MLLSCVTFCVLTVMVRCIIFGVPKYVFPMSVVAVFFTCMYVLSPYIFFLLDGGLCVWLVGFPVFDVLSCLSE